MELKSKSSQNRVPKQSLREDMSTERQAKNKKKQKARKVVVLVRILDVLLAVRKSPSPPEPPA